MEDKKNPTLENTVKANAKETETIADTNTYDPDNDYYDEIFFYNENCFSCRYWLGYDCSAPTSQCSYEEF